MCWLFLSSAWTASRLSLPSKGRQAGDEPEAEGTHLGQLTQIDLRDVPHHITLQSAAEGKEANVGTVVVMLFGSKQLLEVWRPKEWQDICLPLGSNEY